MQVIFEPAYFITENNMTMKNIPLGLIAFALLLVQSCVPNRKYQDMLSAKEAAQQETEAMRSSKERTEATNKELNATVETLTKRVTDLSKDTATLGAQYRQIRMQYDKINELNDILSKKSNELLGQASGDLGQASGENRKLTDELSRTQEALQKKEDALKLLEKNLNDKQADIDAANTALADKQKRVEDMEKILAEQQAASEALKTKVQNALLGFKDKGLTVTEKDGKVYVSMEAKLLFASGSTAVDPNGKKALVDLAKAIEGETDMEIIVEGHTDTDKLSSKTSPKDNWELSVLRATEVVKIITGSSIINPTVLTAAGRSEYVPVSATDKAKNRRIEIIKTEESKLFYSLSWMNFTS